MQKCEKCGKVILNKNQGFCNKCGTPLSSGGEANCTIDGGIQSMSANKFSEATSRWRASIKRNGHPCDEDYRRMIEATCTCITEHVSDSNYYSRNGISDIALDLPERDVMEDVLSALAGSADQMRTKHQMNRLAAEYMFFVFDSFGVYPDFADMVKILRNANRDLQAFRQRLDGLPGESRMSEVEIGFHIDYTGYLADRINERIHREGRDRMKVIVDFWSKQSYLPYDRLAVEAAESYSKAKTARKRSDRSERAADAKVNEFLDTYFLTPFGGAPNGGKKGRSRRSRFPVSDRMSPSAGLPAPGRFPMNGPWRDPMTDGASRTQFYTASPMGGA